MHHYRDILNYFDKTSTNAAAESFNAKIKNFRMQLRGVKDRSFFLFRLTKLFADQSQKLGGMFSGCIFVLC